jgi:hypothetical protein
MKNISNNNKLAILGTVSFLVSIGFSELGMEGAQLAALFCFGFSFGCIFFNKK